jgi:hypothetical protein
MSSSIGRALRKMPTEQQAGWPHNLTGKSERLMGIKPGLEANPNDSLGSSATKLWYWSTSCVGVTWDVLSRDARQSVAWTMSSRERHVDIVTFLKEEWHMSLKNSGNYIYHYALIFKNCTLPTQVIHLLCMSRRTNGDYILKQRSPASHCFLRGTGLDFRRVRKIAKSSIFAS